MTYPNPNPNQVINTAVDGLRGHSSFKAKTNAFGTLFAFNYDHDQWHGHAVAVGSAATVITHSKVSDRGVDWHGAPRRGEPQP